jgi:hypothetical protein
VRGHWQCTVITLHSHRGQYAGWWAG